MPPTGSPWRRHRRVSRVPLLLLCAAVALTVVGAGGGCQTTREAYYNAWESMGYAKRERLVDNVRKAAAAQEEAKEQFTTALEQFKSVVNFDGGNLEKMYNQLDDEYENSAEQAEKVKGRIKSVKNVATALFSEWGGEIKEMSDPSLRRKSEELLEKTRDSYEQLETRMDAAAASMDPVLKGFRDRVLFVKHNLNAQAIASLKGTELELGREIEGLVRQMEASIAEAAKFIAELKG
jgi:ElaB/YqjD/DUF883 family membrane-anchored ribosome-binding protein